MLTPQEINFLYQLLDQINVRGEEQKLMVLTIMQKLRQVTQSPAKEEEEDAAP